MNVKNRLRNNLIRKIQQLPIAKLTEINVLLRKIEGQLKKTDKTLTFAGIWRDMDNDFFTELTDNLHDNRQQDS